MTAALIFSIILLIICTYAMIGTFLNWELSKKVWAKGKSFTLFDKVLSIILFIISLIFFGFILI